MKNVIVKFSETNEVQKVAPASVSNTSIKKRIDEEGLFNLFTANIIKLKKVFTR